MDSQDPPAQRQAPSRPTARDPAAAATPATCPSRIRCQTATGSWTKSRQWETQRTLFSSARATMWPPAKVDGVWPFQRRVAAYLVGGDEGDGAEAKFAAPAADDEALDPAAGAGRLDVEVEAVAVDVVPRRGGADEGGGERLVGMAASALGFAG